MTCSYVTCKENVYIVYGCVKHSKASQLYKVQYEKHKYLGQTCEIPRWTKRESVMPVKFASS